MITKTQIRDRIARLQKLGYDIEVGWAYGQPRVTNLKESRDLSPRCSTGELMTWIDGFEAGIEASETLRKALERATPWLGKMIADGGHMNAVAPNDCIGALEQAEAALKIGDYRNLRK